MRKIEHILMRNITMTLALMLVFVVTPCLLFPKQASIILCFILPGVMYWVATNLYGITFRNHPKYYSGLVSSVAAYIAVFVTVMN